MSWERHVTRMEAVRILYKKYIRGTSREGLLWRSGANVKVTIKLMSDKLSIRVQDELM
jgi:hypothetical protein